MSSMKRKSLLAIAVITLAAVPLGAAAADDPYGEGQSAEQLRLRMMDQSQSEFSAFETVTDRSTTQSQTQSRTRSGERGTMWDQDSSKGAESRTNAFYPETQQLTP